MKPALKMLFFTVGLLLSASCDEEVAESPELPPAPELIASPPDTALDETGIDAVPEGVAIQVMWRSRPEYAGYALHRRGEGEAAFRKVRELGAADTVDIDDDVNVNTRYYYYLRARDESRNWSPPSDTLDYQLIPKAYNLFTEPGTPVVFHWHISGIAPDLYILKLFDDESDQRVWQSFIEPSYQTQEAASFNWDETATMSELTGGRRYRWRIDSRGSAPRSGGESDWQRFRMP